MTTELRFDEYWPHWPDGVSGIPLVDSWLEIDFLQFMNMLWSTDSTLINEANKERHFTDFCCTDWVTSIDMLPDLPGGFDWIVERQPESTSVANISGKLRKVRFVNKQGIGMIPQAFKTEEVQRCITFEINKKCTIDACVSSSAPLCENIRVLCRYNCEVHKAKKVHLTVTYHVVYLQPVNMLVKMTLEKAVKDGLNFNYKVFVRILNSYVPEASIDDALSETGSSIVQLPETPIIHTQCAVYEPLINWSRIPLLALLLTALNGKDPSSSASLFCWRFIAVLLHIYLLSFLFGFFTFAFEKLLSFTRESYSVPEFSFMESIIGALFLLITLEAAQLIINSVLNCLLWLRKKYLHLCTWIVNYNATLSNANSLVRHTSAVSSSEDAREGFLEGSDSVPGLNFGDDPDGTIAFSTSRTISSWIFPYSTESSKALHEESLRKRTKSDGSFEEEVFENERLQPFRGWGHTWPGHFLPTDHCSHWSTFDYSGELLTSNDFALIEPRLPDGWEWIDHDWKIDTDTKIENSIDTCGWWYGLDFPWLKYGNEKNVGSRKISDFVRRRRYYRRRKLKSEHQTSNSKLNKEEHVSDQRNRSSESLSYFSFFNFV